MISGVLVNTSVWVAHFRDANPTLIELLKRDMVLFLDKLWC